MTEQEFNNIFKDEYTKTVSNMVRYGRNGRKYFWDLKKISKQQALKIINKYGYEQISDTTIWLETGV